MRKLLLTLLGDWKTLVHEGIVTKQAFTIDKLQMQCDWLEQLAIIEGENLRKVMSVGRLWEPNDIY